MIKGIINQPVKRFTLAIFLCLCNAFFQTLEFHFDGVSPSLLPHQGFAVFLLVHSNEKCVFSVPHVGPNARLKLPLCPTYQCMVNRDSTASRSVSQN